MKTSTLLSKIPNVLIEKVPQKTFLVGGCVRDHILKCDINDFDIVVDLTETEFRRLFPDIEMVGKSFPVFLIDNNEVALTRTESKNGVGYTGFQVDKTGVGIISDLKRRDLTMNAIAMDVNGNIIDPFNGIADMRNKTIKHVSIAFAEDPVRVLRAARFHARYGFKIHPETIELMSKVVPELDKQCQERIFLEIKKGLSEKYTWKMFDALKDCGALDIDAMSIYRAYSKTLLKKANSSVSKFIAIGTNFKSDLDYIRHCIPTEYSVLNKLFKAHYNTILDYELLSTSQRLDLIMNTRALTNKNILVIFDVVAVFHNLKKTSLSLLINDIELASKVDAEAIAKQFKDGMKIKSAVFDARVKYIESCK